MSDIININKNIPNLFNFMQSTLTNIGNDLWPWDIKCLSKKKYVFIACGYDSWRILDISNPFQPKTVSIFGGNGASYDGVSIDEERNIAYLGHSELGVEIYDIKDVKNVKLIKTLKANAYMNDSDNVFI